MSLTSTSSTEDPPTSLSTDDKHASIDEEDGKFEIFLGGSCNPTTWRQTVAIPYLETNGISYYNPQVDNWTPEVVKIERRAKQNAQVLLFVIDKQTRSTVSLVESAYMAGESTKLVLVIYPFDFDVLSLSDTTKQTTSNVIETRSELTKTNLNALYNSKSNSSSVLKSTSSSSSSSTTISATVKLASGAIRMNNETISLSEFMELRTARFILQNLIATRKTPVFSDIPQALDYICGCLVRKRNSEKLQKIKNKMAFITSHPPSIGQEAGLQDIQRFPSICSDQNILKDVYLSLDDDNDIESEPEFLYLLKEKGLTYNYRPLRNIIDIKQSRNNTFVRSNKDSLSVINSWNEIEKFSGILNAANDKDTKIAMEREMESIQSSRVLLFVITNRCRGLSIMVLASHFMALFRNNVVLCIQYLEESCSIGGETLTETAIADYNRGRVYLCDYAVKSQVPVFKTINEAVDCCSQKCGFGNKNKT